MNAVIALAVSALIAFGFCSFAGSLKYYVLVGAFLSCATTLVAMIGVVHEHERRGVNVRVLGGLFLVFFLLLNAIFAFVDLSPTAYIVLSGLGLLVFVFVANLIGSVQQ
ncbi:hypothetical protein GHT07_04880 [Caenimonas koreensis DSM 17982]|uniref:Uncharacterized protein n=1 Tax=Caenimonas koreensis DSM 17982 TaxID=1121255 RepID=A0A844B4J5_9BURK|nr:hypothetical protein [Caenimonas koreensis DSM 17982]